MKDIEDLKDELTDRLRDLAGLLDEGEGIILMAAVADNAVAIEFRSVGVERARRRRREMEGFQERYAPRPRDEREDE